MQRFVNLIIGLLSLAVAGPMVEGARILAVFPPPSLSHLLIYASVAETLADDGHNVTVIAGFPNMLTKAKYKYIHIRTGDYDTAFLQDVVEKQLSLYQQANAISKGIIRHANDTMSDGQMQDFLKTYKAGDFDLVILGYFMNDFLLGLSAHFQCPTIVVYMLQPALQVHRLIGNPAEVSHVPLVVTGIRQPMAFASRLKNFVTAAITNIIIGNIMLWKNEIMYRLHFPADRYPPLAELYQNVSLVLTNHHFSQGPIRPNVPALIEIGGIQIKEKTEPLPEDLAHIMDAAQNGIIYFSLGTNIQGSHLTKEKAKMIFNVLSKLPYTVLMKWGDTDFPGQSPNIIYRTWLPQNDILAHANLKLFITHGGQGGVVESQYHGVPMVGIPFFGDQHSNMANVRKSGFGLSLEYASLTEEDLRSTILEVLNNPVYRDNVQKFSKLYRDRPMTPRQLVRYWVDYVIRHNGAKHMQSPAVYMSWWQLNSWDVIAFLVSVVLGVVAMFVALCKVLCCSVKKGATSRVTKAKKTK